MKSIEVTNRGWATDVSVEVNGYCNHAGAEEQESEVPHNFDDSITVPSLVCRCGAYQIGYQYPSEDGVDIYYEDYWYED